MSFVGEPDAILGLSPRTSVAEDNDNNKTVNLSQKRLAPTREHGDGVKSHELSDSLVLAGTLTALVGDLVRSAEALMPELPKVRPRPCAKRLFLRRALSIYAGRSRASP